MQTYARQGGTSSIFVHDDGLQLITPLEREKRIQFYANHNIGWVARPPHSNDPDGFKRAGRFKKASNMNYGLALSLRMEEKIRELEEQEMLERPRTASTSRPTTATTLGTASKPGSSSGLSNSSDSYDGLSLEDKALQMAIEEVYEENGRKWKPWACNARSLRVGDLILIIDADTIVPEVGFSLCLWCRVLMFWRL